MAAIATAEVEVAAPGAEVWRALTDPELIKQYMFGSQVETDWRPGSPIVWKGEFEGRSYEDKGEVLDVVPEQRITVTHFSPMTGLPDVPENYHTVTYTLEPSDGATIVRLTQDNAGSDEEAEHSSQNWQLMLDGLKGVVEG
jgi:uncharacterized protein YndB with AHSA1/START domain